MQDGGNRLSAWGLRGSYAEDSEPASELCARPSLPKTAFAIRQREKAWRRSALQTGDGRNYVNQGGTAGFPVPLGMEVRRFCLTGKSIRPAVTTQQELTADGEAK